MVALLGGCLCKVPPVNRGVTQLCGAVSEGVPRCGGVCMAGEYEILSHRSEGCVIILFPVKYLTRTEYKILKVFYEVNHNSDSFP